MPPVRMTPEKAEILALEALAWLAGDADGISRFLAVSGLETDTLRDAAGSPELLGALLDFMLLNEAFLVRFCEDASTRPADIHAARHALEA